MTQFFKTYEETKNWLDTMGVMNYKIAPDLKVSVSNIVILRNKEIEFLPVQFDKIKGSFDLSYNNLATLIGSPVEVTEYFGCGSNLLTSLEGSPRFVGNVFNCCQNKLTSLAGLPKYIGTDFNCSNNKLENLEFCPQEVNGYFDCGQNQLSSLEGGPQRVVSRYSCERNALRDLVGAPLSIGGRFDVSHNPLSSLEGLPHSFKSILLQETLVVDQFPQKEYSFEEIKVLLDKKILEKEISRTALSSTPAFKI